jgi:hypothetical protein
VRKEFKFQVKNSPNLRREQGMAKKREMLSTTFLLCVIGGSILIDRVDCGEFRRKYGNIGIKSQISQRLQADSGVLGHFGVNDFYARVRGGDGGGVSSIDSRSFVDAVNASLPLCWTALMLAIFVEVRRWRRWRWWRL